MNQSKAKTQTTTEATTPAKTRRLHIRTRLKAGEKEPANLEIPNL